MKLRIIDIMFHVPQKDSSELGEGILVSEDGRHWEMELDTETQNLKLKLFVPVNTRVYDRPSGAVPNPK